MRAALLAILFVFTVNSGAYAIENGITPYGDFFPGCCKYGVCKKELSDREAGSAIKSYFHRKGLHAGKMKGKGRFVKVDVYRGGKLVDVVVFDKKTGRVRSTY